MEDTLTRFYCSISASRTRAGGVDYLPRVLEPFPLLPTAPLESVPAGAPLLSPPF